MDARTTELARVAVRSRVTRGSIAAALVALVTVAAVVVFAGVVAPGWWRGEGGSYAPKHTLVRTSITPTRSLFGQIVTARADVVLDPRVVDPASVELAADFKPFRVRWESRRVVPAIGRATVVRFAYELQCVARKCLPAQNDRGATGFQVSPTRVTARERGGRKVTARAVWPEFGVQSRLTGDDIAFSTPRIDTAFAAPHVSWAVSPGLVGGIAIGLAGLLVLGAGWLIATVALRDGRPLRTLRIPSHLTPIERALLLAEHAASRGEVPESRKALERLAVELRRSGIPGRADEAEQLAWSQHAPSSETVAGLAEAVRSNGAR
jgi:hypothetical protein